MGIIQCPGCGIVTESTKQFCGQCGASLHGGAAQQPAPVVAAGPQSQQPSVGRTGIIIGVVVFVVLFAAIFWGCSACMNSGSRADTPDFSMTATELSTAYEQNEVAADQRYEDKTLQVTGVVYEIHSLSNSIELEAPGDLSNVICYMEDGEKSAMASLTAGEQVTITGICSGKLGWILVEDCALQ